MRKRYLRKFTLVLFLIFTGFIFSNQKLGKEVPITGNIEQLKYFFESLRSAKDGQVRIAHYGDSIILGDVITEYIRKYYQTKYGGSGIGFIDVYSKTNLMRRSLVHQFSDDWQGKNILQNKSKNSFAGGISGKLSIAGDKSWVEIKNSRHLKTSERYNKVAMFYKGEGKARFTINGGTKKDFDLNSASLVDKVVVKNNGIKKFKIEFENFKDNIVYGLSLENGNGIYVDNFPISGDSGTSLLNLNKDIISEFRKHFNFKLIILNYGVNVSTPNKKVFRIYERKMIKVVEYLKEQFPETSILLISAGDKTVKRNGKFVTDKNVPKLIKTQERIAKKAGVAFWNMASAMGGKNSMNKWVSSAPPMALKDYLHFTHQGGERIAELLISALMKEYEKLK